MSDPTSVPVLRRLWVIILLTCLLITFPVAMAILLTGNVYRRKDGAWQPLKASSRYVYGGLLALWLVAATLKAVLQPGGISGEWERSADPTQSKTTKAARTDAPASAPSNPSSTASADDDLPTCTDPKVIETAKGAIEESPAGTTLGIRVLDTGKAQETYTDPEQKVRRCVAEAVLNSGRSLLTYQVMNGPSGKVIIQAQIGDTAAQQYEVDKTRREEAERAALDMVRKAVPSEQDGTEQPAHPPDDSSGR